MEKADKMVAQHNALINARFSFLPLQMRLFLSLLARIEAEDTDFQEHFIPLSELVFDRRGGSAYEQVDEMCKKLTSFTLYIEELEESTRRRRKKPGFTYLPLMSEARYAPELGGVIASFNPKIMPYLLQLRQSGNFTLAALHELRKLRSPHSLRIYWLLKEYADFGQRTLTLEQLRFVLNIAEEEYPRFSNFRRFVLERAREELAGTDLPFTFELERQNQIVQRIKFLFQLQASQVASKKTLPSEVTPTEWGSALQEMGVSKRSIAQIAQQLKTGEYDLGYVDFVMVRLQKQHELGKVKKLAGAVYKALVEKYLLSEYSEGQQSKAASKHKMLSTTTRAESEVAFRMSEVRKMYENPGPFFKKHLRATSFEEHVAIVYLKDGFVVEQRDNEEWLIKPC